MTLNVMIGFVITILAMVFACFFTSGVDWGIAGSVFERKSTPEQRGRKAAEAKGSVVGGRKQGA